MNIAKGVRNLTPHTILGVALVGFLIGWFGTGPVLEVVGVVLLAGGFVACGTFLYVYRPWWPSKHGRAGRHLLAMTWALFALFGVSLYSAAGFPLGPRFGAGLTFGIVSALVFVTWERVYLRAMEMRERDRLRPVDAEGD